jgi:DNA repair protein RecO (recombination protein O)
MIEKADAIILNSKKYRETSKILTLYTKEFGKLNMVAKGSRAKNNKFGGSLEILSHVSVVFYHYPQKEYQYITQSNINNYYKNIHSDINKTMTAMSISEIVYNTMHLYDPNHSIFNLLLDTFDALEVEEKDFLKYLVYFQIHYAQLLGYMPNFSSCTLCGVGIESDYMYDSIYFNINSGSLLCGECSKKTIVPLRKSSYGSGKIINKFHSVNVTKLKSISVSLPLINEVFSIFHLYLKNHVPGMKDLKSLDLLFSMTI